MDGNRLHRPSGKFAALSITPIDMYTSPEDVYLILDSKLVDLALGRVENCVWAAHNLPFDITQLRQFADIPDRRNVWCSLMMEKILWSGYYSDFSAADLARRYCNIRLDKDVRKKFINATEMTDELIHYAATDGIVEGKFIQEQIKVVKKNPWAFGVWKDIDMPAMWTFLKFAGFRLDRDEWLRLEQLSLSRADAIREKYTFNPGSWQQVLKALKETGF